MEHIAIFQSTYWLLIFSQTSAAAQIKGVHPTAAAWLWYGSMMSMYLVTFYRLFWFPSASKKLVFNNFERNNCSGTFFQIRIDAFIRPIMLPNALLRPVMLFHVEWRNHAISDLENPFVLRKILCNFKRFLNGFWTLFERILNALERERFFCVILRFSTLCVFYYILHFSWC